MNVLVVKSTRSKPASEIHQANQQESDAGCETSEDEARMCAV